VSVFPQSYEIFIKSDIFVSFSVDMFLGGYKIKNIIDFYYKKKENSLQNWFTNAFWDSQFCKETVDEAGRLNSN